MLARIFYVSPVQTVCFPKRKRRVSLLKTYGFASGNIINDKRFPAYLQSFYQITSKLSIR